MSYSIVYGKQFLKTSRGIIPLILAGCNNVYTTNYCTGKQVRERSWYPMFIGNRIEFTDQEFLDKAKTVFSDEYQENWRSSGKWVDNAGAVAFCQNGVRSARTIEEIRSILPYQYINCRLTSYSTRPELKQFDRCYLKTTKEIEDWIDFVLISGIDLSKICVSIGFSGSDPIRLGRTKMDEPVLAKRKRLYVANCTPSSISFSRKREDAIVFDSVSDAVTKLSHWRDECLFVKAIR